MSKKKSKNRSPFGKLLVRQRKEQGLTMKALGEAVGISESYVSLLESGERKQPSRELVLRLARVLGASPHNNLADDFLVTAGYYPTNKQSYQQHGQTLQAYREQLRDEPHDFDTYTALIFALIKTGETAEAQEMIQQGLSRFDDTIQLQSLLGSLELAKKNFEKSIAFQKFALEQALAAQLPDEALQRLQLNLGVMHFLFAYDISHRAQQAAHQKAKNAAQLGQQALQEFKTAHGIFQDLLQAQPENIYILDESARVSFNLAHWAPKGDKNTTALWQQTIVQLQKILRSEDKFSLGQSALFEACVFLAHAYSQIEAFEQAENLIHSLEVMVPEPRALVFYLKACFYSLKSESKDRAENDLEQALKALLLACQIESDYKRQAQYDPDLKGLRASMPGEVKQLCEA